MKRHKIDIERSQERFEKESAYLEKWISRGSLTGIQAIISARAAFDAGIHGFLTVADLNQCIELLRQSIELRCGYFRAAMSVKKCATIKFGSRTIPLRIDDESDLGLANTEHWFRAFFLALAFGTKKSVREITKITSDQLNLKNPIATKFELALIDYIHSLWHNETEIEKQDGRCSELIPRMRRGPSWERMIGGSWMVTWSSFRAKDQEAVGILIDAIEMHKEYWTDSRDHKLSPWGFVSIPLLGLVRWFRGQVDFDEMRSDYVPEELIVPLR